MRRLLDWIIRRLVKEGALRVTYSNGRVVDYGDGTGRRVQIRFKSAAAERLIATNPDLHLGEVYMDGEIVLEEGTIYDFLELFFRSSASTKLPAWVHVFRAWRHVTKRLHHINPVGRAQRNVAHHYDLDGRFYRLFLDSDEQYSCAYFEHEDDDIEAAQLAKKRHLAAKLDLGNARKVLDIGSGWGGLGLYIAGAYPVDVTGVTLSVEQHGVSEQRARDGGLDDRVHFLLQDYRELQQRFDRIVSVGMFEHVGVRHYREFFDKVSDLLEDDGVMVLHFIGRHTPPAETNAWIQKYIFPGGFIPALSEVLPHIEKSGLIVADVEVLRLHYAETLRKWREQFTANWKEAARLYDERFCRMWEFYLASSESAFRYQGLVVFQIQLVKSQTAVPLTRDYIQDNESLLRAREERRDDRRIAAE